MSQDSKVTLDELEEIVLTYQGPLLRYATRLINNKEDAKEIVNDAFYRFFRYFDYGKGNPKNWLYTVTKRLCFDRLKKKKIEQCKLTEQIPVVQPVASITNSQSRAVKAVVDSLDERYQVLFALKFEHHYTYEEIGQLLGVKSGTVGCMIFNLKKMIKEKLQP